MKLSHYTKDTIINFICYIFHHALISFQQRLPMKHWKQYYSEQHTLPFGKVIKAFLSIVKTS